MIQLTPGTELGAYRLDSLLGYGGMGAVFAATDLRLFRPVAVKVIRPDQLFDDELRERFIREARAAAAVEHPNVVPVYEVGAEDGLLFIVMRYVAGTTLHDVISEGALPPERSVAILSQVGSGLHAAHELGLIHRDVKPTNVLLADHGNGDHAYLADFGLARFVAATGLTATGQTMGTLPYISPEQLQGLKVDRRTDVYALGCVLYEMLTGSVPFPRNDSGAIMYAYLNVDPPMPSDAEPTLKPFDPIVARAMAKAADDRFPSALDLVRAVRDVGTSSPAGVESRTSKPQWPTRFTDAFLRSTVPTLRQGELDELVSELRRRNWGDDDLSSRVFSLRRGEDGDLPAIVLIYKSIGEGSRTRELLRVLPAGRGAALTPAELGERMHPDETGLPLGKASVRAVIRNYLRVEKRLLLEERISRRVLCADWDGYDTDGAGRYYVEELDRQALDAYLNVTASALGKSDGRADPEPLVLVWQRNPRPAVIHRTEMCPTLGRSVAPPRSTRFQGPGTAGWLGERDASALQDARWCRQCG